jgi:hypothetical protein
MTARCIHWSIVNKQCHYNYNWNNLINSKDIIPYCDGFKSIQECCWYRQIEVNLNERYR